MMTPDTLPSLAPTDSSSNALNGLIAPSQYEARRHLLATVQQAALPDWLSTDFSLVPQTPGSEQYTSKQYINISSISIPASAVGTYTLQLAAHYPGSTLTAAVSFRLQVFQGDALCYLRPRSCQ